jgi:hypothetical protein
VVPAVQVDAPASVARVQALAVHAPASAALAPELRDFCLLALRPLRLDVPQDARRHDVAAISATKRPKKAR